MKFSNVIRVMAILVAIICGVKRASGQLVFTELYAIEMAAILCFAELIDIKEKLDK